MEVYQKHSSTAGYLFCQKITVFNIPPDKLHIVMGVVCQNHMWCYTSAALYGAHSVEQVKQLL